MDLTGHASRKLDQKWGSKDLSRTPSGVADTTSCILKTDLDYTMATPTIMFSCVSHTFIHRNIKVKKKINIAWENFEIMKANSLLIKISSAI